MKVKVILFTLTFASLSACSQSNVGEDTLETNSKGKVTLTCLQTVSETTVKHFDVLSKINELAETACRGAYRMDGTTTKFVTKAFGQDKSEITSTFYCEDDAKADIEIGPSELCDLILDKA